MDVDWNEYEPYIPVHEGLLTELSRCHAREEFSNLMQRKSDRVRQLKRLLAANRIKLKQDLHSVQLLNDIFRLNVEKDAINLKRIASIWCGVINDIAPFLGDLMISMCFGVPTWRFNVSSKRDVSYQRHVISGFPKADPRYYVDIDLVVATYGHQIIEGQT